MIDVRSPGEFARGAIPGAINLPVLSNDEREAVGTRYREHGQQAAITLGEQLVSGTVRDQRLAGWCEAVRARPDSLLYCWRGGLRSQIVQEWMHAAGYPLARVRGGFKALRHVCLQAIEGFSATPALYVLGGRTGSGKTVLLNRFEQAIDLEGLANHRGSAFGGTRTAQPVPVDFENALAIRLLSLADDAPVLVEDESRTIGRLAVPAPLHAAMHRAPLVILEVDLETRCAHIWGEYVAEPLRSGHDPETLGEAYLGACDRIQRRLGGVRHAQVRAMIADAFKDPADPAAHYAWIGALLTHYYDPMYDYQLSQKRDRIIFSGPPAAVGDYLQGILVRES